jgi:hypothetical protein
MINARPERCIRRAGCPDSRSDIGAHPILNRLVYRAWDKNWVNALAAISGVRSGRRGLMIQKVRRAPSRRSKSDQSIRPRPLDRHVGWSGPNGIRPGRRSDLKIPEPMGVRLSSAATQRIIGITLRGPSSFLNA